MMSCSKIVRLVSFFLVLTTIKVVAQPCATLQIQGPPGNAVPCEDTLQLSANITFPDVFNTNTYSGAPIPFAPEPFTGGNSIITNIDDCWSGIVQLPFPFCYFGQVYNSCVIGANGQVSFDTVGTQPPLIPGSNNWASATWVAPLNQLSMNNCVMSPFHDLDPGVGGNITWALTGVAPCRKMVVNFISVPMFSCNAMIDTQQVVLHEMTNMIDINIKNKPLCANWNSGVAHEGIQNANGTLAFMVPGRNGTQWVANDDAYRFTPNGPATPITYTYTWIDLATSNILGTDSVLTIPPPVTVSDIICQVNVQGGCSPYSFADTINLNIGAVVADFDYEIHHGCTEDTVVFTNLTFPATPTTYYWTFGDPSIPDTSTNPSHIYQFQSTFAVTLIANHPICISDTIVKVINTSHPLNALITTYVLGHTVANEDSLCLGERFRADAISSFTGLGTNPIFEWNWGDGTPIETGVITDPFGHLYTAPGTYTLTLILTDSIGCKDTATRKLYVEQPAFEDFTMSDSLVCVGEPINFNDTIAPHAISFQWDFGDGKVLPDMHNPNHTYDKSGNYVVTLTSNYSHCPPHTTSRNVEVEEYPDVDLGKDSSICPGLDGSIVLSNLLNPSQLLLWNNGTTTNSFTVTESGHYWGMASSLKANCRTTDSIFIARDCYINIPNSFSPNGDGLNDYFFPRELLSSGVTVFRMNIYNRWGENIFTTNKIDGRGWDGKFNEKPQNMGVYVYEIDVVFKNLVKKTFRGNVTLVR